MKAKIVLLIVISSLIIGCVENQTFLPNQTVSSKNIIPGTLSDINNRISNCGTTIQCDNLIENHINGNYVRWDGSVSDARDNILVVSVASIPLGNKWNGEKYITTYYPDVRVNLYGLSKEDLLKFKIGDNIEFIGKINIKKSYPPYYNGYVSVWNSMILLSPFGAPFDLYDVTIEQPNVDVTPNFTSTVNPCLISENPPYPNGWTKEQVQAFNNKIKDQPCKKLGS